MQLWNTTVAVEDIFVKPCLLRRVLYNFFFKLVFFGRILEVYLMDIYRYMTYITKFEHL